MGLAIGLPCCDCGNGGGGGEPCTPIVVSPYGSVGNYCELGAPFTTDYWNLFSQTAHYPGWPLQPERPSPTAGADGIKLFYPESQTAQGGIYRSNSQARWQMGNLPTIGHYHYPANDTDNSFRITFDLTTDATEECFIDDDGRNRITNSEFKFIVYYGVPRTGPNSGQSISFLLRRGAMSNGVLIEALIVFNGSVYQSIGHPTTAQSFEIIRTPFRRLIIFNNVVVFSQPSNSPIGSCTKGSAAFESNIAAGVSFGIINPWDVWPGGGTGRVLHLVENFCIEHFTSAAFSLVYFGGFDFEHDEIVTRPPTLFGDAQLPLSFSLYSGSTLPTGVTLDAATGILSGTVNEPTAITGTFSVKLTDGTSDEAFSPTYQWRVAAFDIEYETPYSTTNAPEPFDGFDWSFYGSDVVSLPVTITSGASPFIFEVLGDLPNGITLDTVTGDISGTVSESQSWLTNTVTINATDANSRAATATYKWMLTAPFTIVYPDDYHNAGGTSPVGIYEWVIFWGFITGNYSLFPTITGGVAPFSFELLSGAVPSTGGTLNTLTGEIQGLAGVSNTGTCQVRVTDSIGNTADSPIYDWITNEITSGALSIYYPAAPYSNTATPPTAGKEFRYDDSASFSLSALISGGTGPYTVSVSAGALPGRIALNATTGDLTDQAGFIAIGYTSGTATILVTDSLAATDDIVMDWETQSGP